MSTKTTTSGHNEAVAVRWHHLAPWPISDDPVWHRIGGYLADPATRQELQDSEDRGEYPHRVRQRLHDLGLSEFLAECDGGTRVPRWVGMW
jgi:hypothetical protein